MAGQFLTDPWAARDDCIDIITVAEAQLLLHVPKPDSLSPVNSSVLRSSSAIT